MITGKSALLLGMSLIVGCGESSQPKPSSPGEGTWQQQIEQVRSDVVDRIQAESLSPNDAEFQLLQQGCGGLRWLETDISNIPVETFQATLASLPQLERLKLGGPVTDDHLAAIAGLENLRILNLPEGEFTNEGLTQLAGHSKLELLRFRSAHVSDEGLRAVAQLPALRWLHLIDVPVTDAGLPHLYALSGMESFYLDGGRCTEAGLSALLEKLPGLHFHWNQLHLPGDEHAH